MPDAHDIFGFLGLALIGGGIYLLSPEWLGYYFVGLGVLFTAITVWSIVKNKARAQHGVDH